MGAWETEACSELPRNDLLINSSWASLSCELTSLAPLKKCGQ